MSPHDLLKLNVNEHTEKKNGLTYLSWAWAWAEALKADATASFIVHTFADKPYMDVNGTGMVWVTVTMFGQGRIYSGDDLPQSDDAPTTMGELTKKEDGPKYEKIIAKTAPKKTIQVTEWDNSDESRKLFTEGMIEWTTHCTTVAGLNSYWKSNELQLDSLKVTHPPLYEEILSRFKTLKQQLTEETK